MKRFIRIAWRSIGNADREVRMRRNSAHIGTEAGQAWIGVNFWSRTGGPLMWRDYRPEVIAEELGQLSAHGVNLTRSFLYWPDFQPEPDRLDEEKLASLADFLDRHTEAGMQTIPTFIVGHMSGENWDPAWRGNRSIFGDVWFVARQAWYIRQIVSRFANHPAIAGWLLTNEVPIYADWQGLGTSAASEVTSWAQILIDAVRAAGATQPVSVGEGAWGVEVTGSDNGFRLRELEPLIDFFGPHVYRMETDQVRQHLGAAFICELLDIGGKPVVMEEFGLTSDYVDEDSAGDYYRQVLHNTLLAGATGWIPWNNVDYDALEDQRPYSHHPFEMHFGIIDKDGRPKQQLMEVQRFAELLERVEFAKLSRPDTRSAILVTSYLEAMYPFTHPEDAPTVFQVARQAYVSAREADLPIGVARETDGVPDDLALILVPSTKALLAPTWTELQRRAEQGAIIYASYFNGVHDNQRGSWWPNLDEMFGVRKRLKYGLIEPIEGSSASIRFIQNFGEIATGTVLDFAVAGTESAKSFVPVEAVDAEVVAVDAQGRPALLRRRLGSGAMILATYPFEYLASAAPYVNPEPTWLLYQALALEAGTAPTVSVNDPRVLVSAMIHEDGREYVWFISQADQPLRVTPTIHTGTLRSLEGDERKTIELNPFGVEVLQRTP